MAAFTPLVKVSLAIFNLSFKSSYTLDHAFDRHTCVLSEPPLPPLRVFFSTHITSDLDKIADMLIMINNGHIIFQEDKDFLLDTYRIVKGDAKALTDDVRRLFLNISETEFGFTGVTRQVSEVRTFLSDAVIERPAIEDILLANIGGYKK